MTTQSCFFSQDHVVELTEKVAGIGRWRIDAVENKVYWSDHVYTIHGLTSKTHTPDLESCIHFFHPEDRDQVTRSVREAIEQKSTFEFESRLLRADSAIRWVLLKGEVELDDLGEVVAVNGVVQDVTDRRAVEEELREKTLVFETILEGALAGYWDWHIPDNYEYLSPTFKSMFGYEDHELPNRPDSWQKMIHPDDLPGVLEAFDRHVQSRGDIPFVNEVRYFHKDGSVVWVCCRGKVIEWDEDGKPLRMVGSHVNITSQKEVEQSILESEERFRLAAEGRKKIDEELQNHALELERYNEELEQFAYIASHDLQEPLRKIQAFAERLAGKYADSLDDKGREYLDRMQNAANRMQNLIRDLLVLSRVTSQAKPFERIDLRQIAREVVNDFETHIEDLRAEVVIKDLHSIVADPVQIRQLFQNLIGNALKFHKDDVPPKVIVSGAIVEHPGTRPEYRIQIEDNGIGFDEKYLDRIFMPFQRLHGRMAFNGTGMGTAIVKKIVDRHGGSITARSSPGKGATFIITLPVHYAKNLYERNS